MALFKTSCDCCISWLKVVFTSFFCCSPSASPSPQHPGWGGGDLNDGRFQKWFFSPPLISLCFCSRKYLIESFKSESRSEAKDNERRGTYWKDHVRRREDPPICYRLLVPQSSPSPCQHASIWREMSYLSLPFPDAERHPVNAGQLCCLF